MAQTVLGTGIVSRNLGVYFLGCFALGDPGTPDSAWRKLAADRDLRVIFGLLRNPSAPEDVLEGCTRLERLEGLEGNINRFRWEAEWSGGGSRMPLQNRLAFRVAITVRTSVTLKIP